jgi:hypothetical protein
MAKAVDNVGLSDTAEITINVQNTAPAVDGYVPVVLIGALIAGLAWAISTRRFKRKYSSD